MDLERKDMIVEWGETIKLTGAVLGILGGILSPIIGIFIWMFRKTFVSHEDLDAAKKERAQQIEKITERLNEGDQRLGSLENQLKQLPTKDQVHALSNELKGVAVGIEGLMKQVDGVGDTVKILIEDRMNHKS